MNTVIHFIKKTLSTHIKKEGSGYYFANIQKRSPTTGRIEERSSSDFEKSFISSKVTK